MRTFIGSRPSTNWFFPDALVALRIFVRSIMRFDLIFHCWCWFDLVMRLSTSRFVSFMKTSWCLKILSPRSQFSRLILTLRFSLLAYIVFFPFKAFIVLLVKLRSLLIKAISISSGWMPSFFPEARARMWGTSLTPLSFCRSPLFSVHQSVIAP